MFLRTKKTFFFCLFLFFNELQYNLHTHPTHRLCYILQPHDHRYLFAHRWDPPGVLQIYIDVSLVAHRRDELMPDSDNLCIDDDTFSRIQFGSCGFLRQRVEWFARRRVEPRLTSEPYNLP